jgi:hypothetical protein
MHRTTATIRMPGPHPFADDPDAPGTCRHCHLVPGNRVHDDQAVAELHAAQDEHRRRAGEVW